ncbi:protein root UVB sensitive 3 [Cocos nucifera]|uniref:Protein root UVB sensitive 3 n=1 Tax=Cocos nucifera TaxID=13894 RepID=A0A8K0ITS4_COCNU|nr:protein root UVB sensitive 3 [Cocos nucifera]
MESGGIEGKDEAISSSSPPTPPSITLEEWRGSSSAKLYRTAVITADPSSLALESVTPDYVPFQMWDTLQGLSTYIRCMLSTQELVKNLPLSLVQLFSSEASILNNIFQYEVVGGEVLKLSVTPRMLMDLVSPLFPSAFVAILCLGSLSRAFTGVASGATRAALTQHFALENNAADISAKEGSQETMATMTGMALGMLLAHVTRGHPIAVWVSFLSLTMFHMYANYKAVRCLSLNTLNNERSSILLQYFMQNGKAKYLLLERKGVIHVINHKEATPADILQSYIHALVLANLVDKTQSLHAESRIWMDGHYPVFIAKVLFNA